ncbi:hypothetical protein BS50DRAFT_576464 [Corynespora cassiicola Philippines]|uniref:Uncharacterized protein n=1 Tax=Corynespora cassiicola Philippines TaxID=1448308 RepID=A0A2T2NFM3_CORCC|nr:hypothetical protein BS50DRAFT_576464 [Corynespora cassiicola Philippines]
MGSPHNFPVFRHGTIWPTSGTRQSQSRQNAYQSGNSVSSRAEGIMTAAPHSRAHLDDYPSFSPSAFGHLFTSPPAFQGNTCGAGFGVPSSSNNTLDRTLESSVSCYPELTQQNSTQRKDRHHRLLCVQIKNSKTDR